MTYSARGQAGDPLALPELSAALGWLPIASLLLAEDGSALEVNRAWTDLSGIQAEDSLRYGWLNAVEPLDRAMLRARLREAAAVGRVGSADFHLELSAARRLSRWWWRPGPAGRLVLCVARLDDTPAVNGSQPRPSMTAQAGAALGSSDGQARPDLPSAEGVDLAQLVVPRLFGVGLVLQSAIGVTDGRAQCWLQEAVDQLDSLIRDLRTAVFKRAPGCHPDVS